MLFHYVLLFMIIQTMNNLAIIIINNLYRFGVDRIIFFPFFISFVKKMSTRFENHVLFDVVKKCIGTKFRIKKSSKYY